MIDSCESFNSSLITAMWARAIISFIFVFIFAFILGGWFLMPHLPPVPDHPVHVWELEYWTTNWAGALLGIVLGTWSFRAVVDKARTQEQPARERDNQS